MITLSNCKKLVTLTRAMIVVALILFFFSYYPIIRNLIDSWIDREEYSHAFLMLPIVIYMIWSKRRVLHIGQVNSSSWWFAALFFNIFIYSFAYLTSLQTLMALSMFMTIIGTSIYLFGLRSIRILFMPLVLFALLIPIPDRLYIELTFPLQLISSMIAENLLHIISVPVLREGNIITIPNMSFEVIEACSGIRSIMTLITLSVVIGYFLLKKNISITLLAIASIPVAIITNIARLLVMILSFYAFKYDLTQGILHETFGVVIFCLGLIILYGLLMAFARCEKYFI